MSIGSAARNLPVDETCVGDLIILVRNEACRTKMTTKVPEDVIDMVPHFPKKSNFNNFSWSRRKSSSSIASSKN